METPIIKERRAYMKEYMRNKRQSAKADHFFAVGSTPLIIMNYTTAFLAGWFAPLDKRLQQFEMIERSRKGPQQTFRIPVRPEDMIPL